MSAYPTPWQQRTMWAALTAFFVVLLIVIAGVVIYVGANLISFLQPILIPVAIALILAYLLDPLVTELCRRKMGRGMAIGVIFASVFIALTGLVWWVVPTISMQSANFARELPGYTQKARDRIVDLIVQYNRVVGGTAGRGKSASSGLVNFLLGTPPPHPPSPTQAAAPTPLPETTASPVEAISATPAKISSAERQQLESKAEKIIPNLERYLPTLAEKIWNIVKKSIGGFLGITGFLLSLIMVPIYLFFLLKERPRIEKRWKDYLPLRASPLKDEIAAALSEINSYVIAYFRGQLLVCLVDGTLIGSILTLFGLNFAPLIGLLVVILTMIPYIGIVICWVPAALIAAFQWGDWTHPLIVTVIFIVVQNLEGMFYAPRIVGKSVGLHPMTVIVSIFVWGLLIGGLLGPILAVPLTATIKVLLTRYVWGARVRERARGEIGNVPVVREAEQT
ncbi:MAG TPA: AI-2E family transporter [Chthoniobacterales bacterium]|jgi:predicted PurR-regulated permease PerM|nr:AI-2E family transporter [Chthoniobacterales bacterium]